MSASGPGPEPTRAPAQRGRVGLAAGGAGAHLETGILDGPALVLHGGAGTFERLKHDPGGKNRARLESALDNALSAGWAVIQNGEGAVRAAVEAVAALEDSGLFNAGPGATRTTDGTIETDAGVMDGRNGVAGGVCAATWPANPVRAAFAVARRARADRSVLEAFREGLGPLGDDKDAGAPRRGEPSPEALRRPTWSPLLLAGAGADRLAESAGLARMRPTGPPDLGGTTWSPAGTVGAVALDVHGHVAAATSTGGAPANRLVAWATVPSSARARGQTTPRRPSPPPVTGRRSYWRVSLTGSIGLCRTGRDSPTRWPLVWRP